MSHSKRTKRGYSLYLERWNGSAKKYINTCVLCGRRGYSPAIECEDFARTREREAIRKELTRILDRLPLDPAGRCEVCAKVQERK